MAEREGGCVGFRTQSSPEFRRSKGLSTGSGMAVARDTLKKEGWVRQLRQLLTSYSANVSSQCPFLMFRNQLHFSH